jgi:DNA-binding transcriptional LysR family regulator
MVDKRAIIRLMELRDLRAFVAVVDVGGMTRAAERLHVVQSAVSQAVKRLERELGLQLLERRPDGVRPTDPGEALARHARLILNSVARAQEDMAAFHGLDKGQLQLGILHTAVPLVLAPLLRKIGAAHPGLQIRVREGRVDELVDLLTLRMLDVAVTFLPAQFPGLEIRQLTSLDLAVVVPADHALANQERVSMRVLEHAVWVSFPENHPGRIWLERACAGAGFTPGRVIEVDTLAHLKTFVESGAGIALLPPQTCHLERRIGSLATLELTSRPRAQLAYVLEPHHRFGLALNTIRPLLEETIAELAETAPAGAA